MTAGHVEFLRGVVFTGYVVIGVFFLHYWRRSRDSLFAWFTATFWLLALERLMMVGVPVSDNRYAWVYLLRLAAFLMLIVAIAIKNRRPAGGAK